jgi:hypothetical protein
MWIKVTPQPNSDGSIQLKAVFVNLDQVTYIEPAYQDGAILNFAGPGTHENHPISYLAVCESMEMITKYISIKTI